MIVRWHSTLHHILESDSLGDTDGTVQHLVLYRLQSRVSALTYLSLKTRNQYSFSVSRQLTFPPGPLDFWMERIRTGQLDPGLVKIAWTSHGANPKKRIELASQFRVGVFGETKSNILAIVSWIGRMSMAGHYCSRAVRISSSSRYGHIQI